VTKLHGHRRHLVPRGYTATLVLRVWACKTSYFHVVHREPGGPGNSCVYKIKLHLPRDTMSFRDPRRNMSYHNCFLLISAGPIRKLIAWGRGIMEDMSMRYDEPRLVWTSLPVGKYNALSGNTASVGFRWRPPRRSNNQSRH
jgi:hypothetical protein